MNDSVSVQFPIAIIIRLQSAVFDSKWHRNRVIGSQYHFVQFPILSIIRVIDRFQRFRYTVFNCKTSEPGRSLPAIQKYTFQIGGISVEEHVNNVVHFSVVFDAHRNPRPVTVFGSIALVDDGPDRSRQDESLNKPHDNQSKCISFDLPIYVCILVALGFSGLDLLGIFLLNFCYMRQYPAYSYALGGIVILLSSLGFTTCGCAVLLNDPFYWLPNTLRQRYDRYYGCEDKQAFHNRVTVSQNLTNFPLTPSYYCNTLIYIRRANFMANVLDKDKQVAIIAALAEGSSIRAIERMTGVHRDTVMRLGVKVGNGCASMLDWKMRNLSCQNIQVDELWGFIGKKERNVREDDSSELGDVWTFCAIDADTKLVPSFKVGKRDARTANAFVSDVASRLSNRIQLSSDAMRSYVEAVELAFGSEVDYAQIVKTYGPDDVQGPERKYSPSEFVSVEKRRVSGSPDMYLASTSYVERLNGTTRLHMRRLTRLTSAFSKKLENFKAAVALHFAYYNFVKRHNSLRCTPAMAAGIERDFWTVENLVEETT